MVKQSNRVIKSISLDHAMQHNKISFGITKIDKTSVCEKYWQ